MTLACYGALEIVGVIIIIIIIKSDWIINSNTKQTQHIAIVFLVDSIFHHDKIWGKNKIPTKKQQTNL